MAITVIQSVSFPTAWSGSFASAVTAGNSIILVATAYTSSGATMSTSAPLYNAASVTGATQVFTVDSGATSGVHTSAWLLPNVSGGHTSVALTMTGQDSSPYAGSVGLIAYEVSGLGSSPTVFSHNTALGTTGTSLSTGATASLTSVPMFVLGSVIAYGETVTAPASPWSTTQLSADFSASSYQIPSSTGSTYALTSTAAASTAWCGGIAAIAPTASITASGSASLGAFGATGNVSVAAPSGITASGSVRLGAFGATGSATFPAPTGITVSGAASLSGFGAAGIASVQSAGLQAAQFQSFNVAATIASGSSSALFESFNIPANTSASSGGNFAEFASFNIQNVSVGSSTPVGTATTAPTAPTGLQVITSTGTTVTLEWASSQGSPQGYYVYANGVSVYNSSGATVLVTGLTPQTAYTFYVVAWNTYGVSGESNSVTVTTGTVSGPPPAPGFSVPPVAPPLPLSDLQPQVEFLLRNNEWLDVTSRVFYDGATGLTVTRGGQDESTTTTPATMTASLDNHDGYLSSLNPGSALFGMLGLNTPIRVSIPAPNTHLRVEEDTNVGALCVFSAPLNTPGDFEVWIDADLGWYGPQILAGRWAASAGERSWMLSLTGDGRLQLSIPNNPTAPTQTYSWVSTVPLPMAHGRMSVRLQYQEATGTAYFYTGQYGGNWTPVGSGTTYGQAISAPSTQAALSIAWCDDQTEFAGYTPAYGKIYGAALLSGLNGGFPTAVSSANFCQLTPGSMSFSDIQGNTWGVYVGSEISDRDYRFHGECSAWPQKWSPGGPNARISLTASGMLRRYNSDSAPEHSAMYRAHMRSETPPVSYWPMEDTGGATTLASAIAGQPPLSAGAPVQVGSDSTFACSSPIPSLNGGSIYGSVPAYPIGTISGQDGSVIRWLMTQTSVEPANANLASVRFTGTGLGRIDLNQVSASVVEIIGYDQNSAQVFALETGISLPGWQGRLSIEYLANGSSGSVVNLAWYGVGQPAAYTIQAYNGNLPVGRATQVVFGGTNNLTSTSVGHLTVQSVWTWIFDMGGALAAYDQEPAGIRFQRICSEEGIPFRWLGDLSATQLLGAQTPETLVQLLQECVDADQGIWFEPRSVLGWGYRTRASLGNQSPFSTMDYNQDHLSGSLEPTIDDQVIKNDVTVSSQTGGSQAQYVLNDGSPTSIGVIGRYDTQITANVSDQDLPSLASWILWQLSNGEPRYPGITSDLANSALPVELYYALLGLEPGDRLWILNPPVWLPPLRIDQLVKGLNETISAKGLSLTWNAIPATPWNVAVIDDAVYGFLDTDSSRLTAGITATATTIQVSTMTAGSPLWTTNPSDLPFDIQLDGEVMTVTQISGTSSPQTFTVTRGVNGVSRAHTSGVDINIDPAPIISL